MTDAFSDRQWLRIPDLVELLGISPSRVRRLIEDKHLLGIRREGVLMVPEVFLLENEPLHELRGTLFVLADAGFSDDEAMRWLLEPEESLEVAPIDALRSGRKTEVRRIAQALA
ncbi:Rv2175c family DNA-binding protein [Rathayibacter sp. YIM 133350]|uniref:Rv2175c family DNA-binding protein n=1 Tax=Rathayibacter sp. YIM 133350 TaxID=3131992 RepID=UPI00307FB283